jgi:hypothetical protein
MPTVQLTADLSTEALLHAIDQLDAEELDRFVTRVVALRDRRLGRCPDNGEEELLGQIRRGLPPELQQRYEQLIEKRDARALNPEEHAELLRLTDRAEQADVERVSALLELARRRRVALDDLLHDPTFQTKSNG